MKQGHFVLIFLVLLLHCFLSVSYEQTRYDSARKEKQIIEEALEAAVEQAAWSLTMTLNESEESRKKTVEEVFFDTLYAALDVMDEQEEQERIKMHIPMLVLVEEKQAFFYYAEESKDNEMLLLQYDWYISKTFDEAFPEAKKKASISEVLEQEAEKIINNHNYIAEQYGLMYTFSVPDFMQNTAEKMELPMVLVVFQGWPLTKEGDIIYENCLDAGAYIQEVEKYVVELPRTLTDTHCYCHRISCNKISESSDKVYVKEMLSFEDAVCSYGAILCPNCMK